MAQLPTKDELLLAQWKAWREENEKYLNRPEITAKYSGQRDIPSESDSSLWQTETKDGKEGSCGIRGKKFALGDVVSVKMKGWSRWPAMIEFSPLTLSYYDETTKDLQYHVTFFGGRRERCWTSEINIKPYEWMDPDKARLANLKMAIMDANGAFQMLLPDRIRQWSVAYIDPLNSSKKPTTNQLTDDQSSDDEIPLGLMHYSSKNRTIDDWSLPSRRKGLSPDAPRETKKRPSPKGRPNKVVGRKLQIKTFSSDARRETKKRSLPSSLCDKAVSGKLQIKTSSSDTRRVTKKRPLPSSLCDKSVGRKLQVKTSSSDAHRETKKRVLPNGLSYKAVGRKLQVKTSSSDDQSSDDEVPLGLLNYSSKNRTIDWSLPSTSKGLSPDFGENMKNETSKTETLTSSTQDNILTNDSRSSALSIPQKNWLIFATRNSSEHWPGRKIPFDIRQMGSLMKRRVQKEMAFSQIAL